MNRFLEEPKDYEPEYSKFFKKNFFFSGNFLEKNNLPIRQNNKKLTLNSPIISELSLNTTININNSSTNPTLQNSYIVTQKQKTKEKKLIKNKNENCGKKSNVSNLQEKKMEKKKMLRKKEGGCDKENNPMDLNFAEKRKSKN